MMLPSSRTPDGEPIRCRICGELSFINVSRPAGDVPCPNCGSLAWADDIAPPSVGEFIEEMYELAASASREEISRRLIDGVTTSLSARGTMLWTFSPRRTLRRRPRLSLTCSNGSVPKSKKFAREIVRSAEPGMKLEPRKEDGLVFLGVPLKQQDQVIGVIQVIQRRSVSHDACRGQLRFIQQAAEIVSTSTAFE